MLGARSWRTRWVQRSRGLSGSISTAASSWNSIGVRSPRTLALPGEVEHWSLTTPREKLVKIGAKVVAHGRYVTFQLAEVAVARDPFRKILRPIDGPRSSPTPASAGDIDGTSNRQERCVWMTRKSTEWPFENGQTEKVGPSDGWRGEWGSLGG